MNEEFMRMMEDHNPFFFRDKRERFCVFKDYAGAYLAMLERLYEQAPAGYIDLVLFMMHYCHMDRQSAEDFQQNFFRSGALDNRSLLGLQNVVMIDWRNIDAYVDKLKGIACGLHWLTESKYNSSFFNQAINMFKAKMKLF